VRVRQHVNPLSRKYQAPITLPNWASIYEHPERPLFLDIGCARGKFLLEMAQLEPEWNYLGIEIRQPLVDAANQWRDALGMTNLHYLFAHANVSLDKILASLPTDTLGCAAIQFPDPWFKRRHFKRRIVQPELVETLVKYLVNGGKILLQSDVKPVIEEMRDCFASMPQLQSETGSQWLSENPFPVATEREIMTLEQGEPVYRMLFVKRVGEK